MPLPQYFVFPQSIFFALSLIQSGGIDFLSHASLPAISIPVGAPCSHFFAASNLAYCHA